MHHIMKTIFFTRKPTLLVLIFLNALNLSAQQTDSLEEVNITELKSDKHTMIALTFGQSNAANRGQKPYTSRNKNVLVYADGKLYHAKDPLPLAIRLLIAGPAVNVIASWKRHCSILTRQKFSLLIFSGTRERVIT